MHTARLLVATPTAGEGGSVPGGVPGSGGVSAPWGCLVPEGAWSGGGLLRVVSGPGRVPVLGVAGEGVGILACTEADPPCEQNS